MKTLTTEMMAELLSVRQTACLSLYLPTHRSHPENLQDPIRFQNLVKQLEETLSKQFSAVEVKELLEPFKALATNVEFWNHTLDGLAVLGTNDRFETIVLPVPVEELTVVADSFHTKPLRNYLQSTDRYHVLGVSLHDIHLFEGNRHSLVEVELAPGIPKTMTEALGEEMTEKHSTVASYGGSGGASVSMHHGHGGKKEEVDKDAERFFRIVSNAVFENYSKSSGLPLILAALPEHHHLFQSVSNNPLLMSKGIVANPKSVSMDKLIGMAWEVMEPDYLQKIEKLGNTFEQAKSKGTGSDSVAEVARAAVDGKIDTLLIEAERMVAGKIDKIAGTIEPGDIKDPRVNDLLDDIGEMVMKKGGRVMVVAPEKMPSQTGVAAVFRY